MCLFESDLVVLPWLIPSKSWVPTQTLGQQKNSNFCSIFSFKEGGSKRY